MQIAEYQVAYNSYIHSTFCGLNITLLTSYSYGYNLKVGQSLIKPMHYNIISYLFKSKLIPEQVQLSFKQIMVPALPHLANYSNHWLLAVKSYILAIIILLRWQNFLNNLKPLDLVGTSWYATSKENRPNHEANVLYNIIKDLVDM